MFGSFPADVLSAELTHVLTVFHYISAFPIGKGSAEEDLNHQKTETQEL